MNKIKIIATAGALLGFGALGLVGGVAYAAAPHQAQTPGTGNTGTPHAVRFAGRVQSVSASGLVLQAGRNQTVNVNVGSDTWVVVEKNNACATGQLSDIQTGKAVAVAGMSTTTARTVDARVVAQGACARKLQAGAGKRAPAAGKAGKIALARHAAEGTVKSINGGTLTVTNAQGKDLTVNTTSSTVVFDNGFAGVSSVKVGDKIQVFGRAEKAQGGTNNGSTAAGRTLTAWAIHDTSANTKIMVGRVQNVNGNTVTLRTPANRNGLALTLDGSTGYKTVTVANQTISLSPAAQADVKAGSNLLVEVSTSADGKTQTARAIVLLPQGKTK